MLVFSSSEFSRAIGWNTNDPLVNDEGWNQSCMGLSPRTYMHTGCVDAILRPLIRAFQPQPIVGVCCLRG